jgi:hypothetical protein
MAEDKMKKLGSQKNVSSIIKDAPIPQENAGDKTGQTPNAPEPEQISNIPEESKSWEPQKTRASLFNKINQSTELLRKDNLHKELLIDADKKVVKPGLRQRIRDKLFATKPGTSSTRQKTTVIMIPVLAFVFILVLRHVFWSTPTGTEAAVDNEKPGAVTTTGTSNEIDWQTPALLPLSLRDPLIMIPSGNKRGSENKTEITELKINGILHSEDNPSVLIGGHIIHEGEKILGATIVKINKDNVEFEMNGKKWKQSVGK